MTLSRKMSMAIFLLVAVVYTLLCVMLPTVVLICLAIAITYMLVKAVLRWRVPKK